MSKAIQKKLKDQLLDMSLVAMLKELGTLIGEIRLETIDYKGSKCNAILIRGKDEKEKPAEKLYKTNPITLIEILKSLHGTMELEAKVIKYVEREWFAIMFREKE